MDILCFLKKGSMLTFNPFVLWKPFILFSYNQQLKYWEHNFQRIYYCHIKSSQVKFSRSMKSWFETSQAESSQSELIEALDADLGLSQLPRTLGLVLFRLETKFEDKYLVAPQILRTLFLDVFMTHVWLHHLLNRNSAFIGHFTLYKVQTL